MDTLFISDLHLSKQRPEKLFLLKQLLHGPARRAQALYILGDLFEEFWVGNDDHTEPSPETLEELKAFSASGVKCCMVRGNRELLLDQGFEPLTGCTLLPDHTVIDLDGTRILIMHGDLLCTRDRTYQMFRAFMETSSIRNLFLGLPYRLRIALAHGLRPLMRRSTGFKTPAIIDIEQAAVEQIMRERGVTELIHGHTHRPGIHEFELDGRRARRIVLGDWYQDPKMLVCSGAERRLVRVSDYVGIKGPE